MAIVLSEIVNQTTQNDGRISVVERHVDHLAKEYIINYIAEVGANLNAKLAQHATEIWENLIESEISKFVTMLEDGILPNPALIVNNYAVKLEIIKRLVKRALRMHTVDAAYKALVLMNWIKANYNNTQIAAFLGVNQTVVTAVMGRFSDLELKVKPLLDTDATKVIEVE